MSGNKRKRSEAGGNSINVLNFLEERKDAIHTLQQILQNTAPSVPIGNTKEALKPSFPLSVTGKAAGGVPSSTGTKPIVSTRRRMAAGLQDKSLQDLMIRKDPQSASSLSAITPRILRRRSNSHMRYRLPQSLRMSTLARNINKSNDLRSRQHRRKPKILNAKWGEERKEALSGLLRAGEGEELAGRRVVRSPLHAWHAKRFHMCVLWGCRVPIFRNDTSISAALRRCRRGFVVHDSSYYVPFVLAHKERDQLLEMLGTVTDSSDPVCVRQHPESRSLSTEGLSRSQKARIRRGKAKFSQKTHINHEYSVMLHEYECFPNKPICPARVLLIAEPEMHRALIWVHPAGADRLVKQLQVAAAAHGGTCSVSAGMSRISVMGNPTVLKALMPTMQASVLHGVISDPRSTLPSISPVADVDLKWVYDKATQQEAEQTFPSDAAVQEARKESNRRVSMLVVEEPEEVVDTADFMSLKPAKRARTEKATEDIPPPAKIPLYVSKITTHENVMAFDIVLPAYAAVAVWRLFPKRASVGIHEWRHLHARNRMHSFPFDYPDTVYAFGTGYGELLRPRSPGATPASLDAIRHVEAEDERLVVRNCTYARDIIDVPPEANHADVVNQLPEQFDQHMLLPVNVIASRKGCLTPGMLLYFPTATQLEVAASALKAALHHTAAPAVGAVASFFEPAPEDPFTHDLDEECCTPCGLLCTAGYDNDSSQAYGTGHIEAEAACILAVSPSWQSLVDGLVAYRTERPGHLPQVRALLQEVVDNKNATTSIFPVWATKPKSTKRFMVFVKLNSSA